MEKIHILPQALGGGCYFTEKHRSFCLETSCNQSFTASLAVTVLPVNDSSTGHKPPDFVFLKISGMFHQGTK